MKIRNLFQRLELEYYKRVSDEKKTKYLRRQGMKVGESCHFNSMSFSTEPYLIELGNKVTISAGCDLVTHDGAVKCFRDEISDADIFGKIVLGNNVFIGINSTILPNTFIGNNCIVGAGSVVRGKFPEDSVIIGNPAKVVMKMSFQKFLYLQNPGLIMTHNLTDKQKVNIVKDHFSKQQGK